MECSFAKYQGTGNDFILVDNRKKMIPKKKEVIQKLCDRKFGIGADGLILIENHPAHPVVDYQMVYYNPDGSQSLCGNGSRCGFAFAQSLEMIGKTATFETTEGVHEMKEEKGLIHFRFFDMDSNIRKINSAHYLNTGSPHYIEWVEDVDEVDVAAKGRKIRNLSEFASQNGTNVHFAQILNGNVKMRTYERGVENETLSCGTGATATALAASLCGLTSPVKLETQGGILKVYFEKNGTRFTNIWLAGPAEKVYEGTILIHQCPNKKSP